MTHHTYRLTDAAEGIAREHFVLGPGADLRLAGSDEWRITKRTLRGGVSAGVEVLEICNGPLSLSLLPTRGMGIWRGSFRGIELGWNSPVRQPVHPRHVDALDRNGLGWLAGFNELMCRCGLSSNGAPGLDVVEDAEGRRTETPLTLHGKIANIPAHFLEVSVDAGGPGKFSVCGMVDESSLFGPCLRLTSTLETEAGSSSFRIRDEITNLGGKPAELELLYHTNLGPPFLEEGAQFLAPIREVAPRDAWAGEGIGHWQSYLAPTAGYVEQCYFVDPAAEGDETVVLLRNAAGDKGFSLQYNRRELPCFTLWKNTQAEADGYVTGLEPGTNFPNLKTYERQQGRVILLEPGQTYAARIDFGVHATKQDVAAVERRIASLQKEAGPIIHSAPVPKYSSPG